jgi:hypothetical protein
LLVMLLARKEHRATMATGRENAGDVLS